MMIRHPRSMPYTPENSGRSRLLRRNMTVAEKKLWFGFLRGFKYRVYRQRTIDIYIADFYCAKLKLVIEVDGDSHYSVEGINHDIKRAEVLRELGITIHRFTNIEVMSNFSGVCEKISEIVSDMESKIEVT